MNTNSAKFTPQKFNAIVTQDRYGISHFFTKSIPALYSDNSMQKHSEKINKLAKERSKVIRNKSLLRAKQERKKAIEQRIELNKLVESRVTSEIAQRIERLMRMGRAAVVIQRHVRGFLARKKTEDQRMEYKRRAILSQINELTQISYNCFYEVGNVRIQAAIVIQRAFRRVKLRCKIERMLAMYDIYRRTRVQRTQGLLRRFIPMVHCRRMVRNMKFEKEKVIKLENFKREQAIKQIRKCWHSLGLNKKILKRKIRALRRKYESKRRKEAYFRHISKLEPKVAEEIRVSRSSLETTNLIDPKAENSSSKAQEEEEENAIIEAMHAIYLIRLKQSKTSYGVRRLRMRKMAPVLTRGNSEMHEESDFETPRAQNLLNFRQKFVDKVKSLFPLNNTMSFRETTNEESSSRHNTVEQSVSKKLNKRSISYSVEDCNYMRSTTSSMARIENLNEESTTKPRKISRTSPRVLSPTISYRTKTRTAYNYPKNEKQLFIVPCRYRTEFSPLPDISYIKPETKQYLSSRVQTASEPETKRLRSRAMSSSVSYEYDLGTSSCVNSPKTQHILITLPSNENLFTKCFPLRLYEGHSNSSCRRRRTFVNNI